MLFSFILVPLVARFSLAWCLSRQNVRCSVASGDLMLAFLALPLVVSLSGIVFSYFESFYLVKQLLALALPTEWSSLSLTIWNSCQLLLRLKFDSTDFPARFEYSHKCVAKVGVTTFTVTHTIFITTPRNPGKTLEVNDLNCFNFTPFNIRMISCLISAEPIVFKFFSLY